MNGAIERFQEGFRRHAGRPCLISADGAALTFAEVEGRAASIAGVLVRSGLRPGQGVAFLCENSVEHALALLGAWTAGLCVTALNGELGLEQLQAIVDRAGALAIVHDARFADLAARLGLPALRLEDFREASGGGRPIFADLAPDAPFLVVYTAGSTGVPKGVQLAPEALLGNEALFCEAMRLGAERRFYGLLPMSYLGGLHNLLLLPMMAGASVVIDKPLGASNLFYFWRRVREREIDVLWFTGAMLSLLLQIPPRGDESWIGEQIALGLVGMAPLAPAMRGRFEERFGVPLHQNYALSETLFLTTQRPGRPADPAGCGTVLPGVEIALQDPATGQPPARGLEGEVCVRTPHMMKGYRGASAQDAAALKGGMFLTGDLGRFNEAGELLVTGRIKDVIIRGGLNISPVTVESGLSGCPLISEVAVIGVSDEIYGEQIAAVVVLSDAGRRQGEEAARAAVLAVAAETLPSFQRPRHLWISDSLPRNAAGKIDKLALRRLYANPPQ